MLFWKQKRFYAIFLISLITVIFPSSYCFGQITYESAPHLIADHNLNIIDQKGKLGLVNNKGAVIVPPAYKKIRINKDKSISGLPFQEWSVLDGQNNFIKTLTYDAIEPLAPNLLKVKMGALEGLADSQGNLITPMRDWQIFPYVQNYALVKEENQYGIIDGGGRITVAIDYDTLILGEDYLVGNFTKNGQQKEWHALQYSGEVLFKKTADQMGVGNQGYFSFLENSSWGFYNYQGERSIPNQYDEVQPFINGKAIARYMDSDGVINRNGEWLIRPRKDHLQHLINDVYLYRSGNESGLISANQGDLFSTTNQFTPLNHGFLEKNEKGKLGLISPAGKRLLTTEYDEISPLQNDSVYFFKKDKNWGIITKTGKVRLNLKNPIQEMYPMGDLFIGVKIDNKYGFVDINGDLRIANRYEAIGEFYEDMAAVKLLGKWGFVDRIERLFVQPRYDSVFPFKNGTAIVIRNGKYGLVNKAGEEVLNASYDSVYRVPSGRYIAVKGNYQGLVGKNGTTLIHPKYDQITDLDNGYVIIYRNGKYGLLTTNGVNTIPLTYDSLVYNPFEKVYMVAKTSKWQALPISPLK